MMNLTAPVNRALSFFRQPCCMEFLMRRATFVYTAAALTAAIGLEQHALGETADASFGNLTVAATWRAQPSTIALGETTTFKLSLNATGDDGTSGISFGQSTFTFASGSASSAPTSASIVLGATAPSYGNTMTASLAPLKVTYFEEGVHTATISASNAPVTWLQDGAARTAAYSLHMGTTVTVGSAVPTLQSAMVPVLIEVGESFGFSALADAGATAGSVNYLWDFDSDGTFDSTSQNPEFAYTTAGVHTGLLRIEGDGGSSDFQYAVDVMSAAAIVPVPLPAAVWGGLGLVSALGAIRARQALRRQRLN
jgi:hypothetical protein